MCERKMYVISCVQLISSDIIGVLQSSYTLQLSGPVMHALRTAVQRGAALPRGTCGSPALRVIHRHMPQQTGGSRQGCTPAGLTSSCRSPSCTLRTQKLTLSTAAQLHLHVRLGRRTVDGAVRVAKGDPCIKQPPEGPPPPCCDGCTCHQGLALTQLRFLLNTQAHKQRSRPRGLPTPSCKVGLTLLQGTLAGAVSAARPFKMLGRSTVHGSTRVSGFHVGL